MIAKINWQAFSKDDRISVIEEVKSAISSNGGAIINFHMFSDLALSLNIEIEERDLYKMHDALSKIVSLSPIDKNEFQKDSKKECWALLNLSFSSGKGLLKNEIPEVPG